MDELLVRWERHLTLVLGRSPRTVSQYGTALERFASFLRERSVRPEDASVLTIESYLESRELPDQSFNAEVAALRSLFAFLKHEKIRADNPAEGLRQRKIHRAPPVPPTFDETIQLVEAARKAPRMYRERNEAMLEILLGRGLRGTELLSLKMTQIDLQQHLFLDVRLKGKKWEHVEFTDLISEKLERYLAVRHRLTKGEDSGFVFLSNRGRALTLKTLEQMVGRYAELAGVARRVTPHDCRRSFATELSRGGTDPRTIQKLLDHERLATTQEYIFVDQEERKAAVESYADRRRRRERDLREGGEL